MPAPSPAILLWRKRRRLDRQSNEQSKRNLKRKNRKEKAK